MKKILLAVIVALLWIATVRVAAQQGSSFPGPADVLTSQAAAGGSLLAAWNWLTDPVTGVLPRMWNTQQAHEARIGAVETAVQNIPAGPAGPIGAPGPQGMP